MTVAARAAKDPSRAMASWENQPGVRLAANSTPMTALLRNGTATIDTCRSALTEASTTGSCVSRSSLK